jgi:hypothetical protein
METLRSPYDQPIIWMINLSYGDPAPSFDQKGTQQQYLDQDRHTHTRRQTMPSEWNDPPRGPRGQAPTGGPWATGRRVAGGGRRVGLRLGGWAAPVAPMAWATGGEGASAYGAWRGSARRASSRRGAGELGVGATCAGRRARGVGGNPVSGCRHGGGSRYSGQAVRHFAARQDDNRTTRGRKT